MASLDVYMNEYYVGIFTKKAQVRIHSNILKIGLINQEVVPSLFRCHYSFKNIKETVSIISLIICYLIILKLEIVL
uniref:HipA-like protein n=1 Tax=Proteus mirabilis TaxID=584 RepID=G8DRC8_PROMI|nr:HipA-like protein [Proteus mirabilis]